MSKTIVLDTNLLILFIVGTVSKHYIPAHKKLHPVYTSEHYDLLIELIKKAEFLVTPHTLTETSNLLKRINDPARTEIYQYFQNLIGKVQERYVTAQDASKRTEFIHLGITDSILLELGKENITLLTADHQLHCAALNSNHPTVNFWHVATERGLFAT